MPDPSDAKEKQVFQPSRPMPWPLAAYTNFSSPADPAGLASSVSENIGGPLFMEIYVYTLVGSF